MVAEEKQLHKRPWRMEVDDGGGDVGWGVHFFSFLSGDESYLQSYPLQSYQRGMIGSHSMEFLGHPTSNPTLNPTPILPKKC